MLVALDLWFEVTPGFFLCDFVLARVSMITKETHLP